jgi:hypothetical protein
MVRPKTTTVFFVLNDVWPMAGSRFPFLSVLNQGETTASYEVNLISLQAGSLLLNLP